MSRLAHISFGALNFNPEKKSQFQDGQQEVREAKRIQQQTGCSWTEALRLAYKVNK